MENLSGLKASVSVRMISRQPRKCALHLKILENVSPKPLSPPERNEEEKTDSQNEGTTVETY